VDSWQEKGMDDGQPGVKNIWRGYRALQNCADALDMTQMVF
jgi:hypothetical protein